MKGFLEEYGLIIVVVAVILLMLLFGKSGYAKSIQDAILGSTNHIVETVENITKGLDVKASDTIEIEGNKYIVLERRENSQALVITKEKFNGYFQYSNRSDGQNKNTYEGSEIDNYLENDWYNSLSSTMKAAIQTTNIKQVSYATGNDPNSKQKTGYNGQVYKTISRHVFLPSVSEIGKVVDFKDPDKVKAFADWNMWTRDSFQGDASTVEVIGDEGKSLYNVPTEYYYHYYCYTRPAFVIDLSKVDYKVTDHVDYK